MSKTYVIMKNGVKMKTVKSLNAAKEIAVSAAAEVFCNGEQIYPAITAITESHTEAEVPATITVPESVSDTDEKVVVDDTEAIKPAESKSYRLTALMNVRKNPSLKAEIIAHAEANTVVKVIEIKDDWMRVSWYDGFAYILYGSGKFAEAARG